MNKRRIKKRREDKLISEIVSQVLECPFCASDQIGHIANGIVCSRCGVVQLVNLSPSSPK